MKCARVKMNWLASTVKHIDKTITRTRFGAGWRMKGPASPCKLQLAGRNGRNVPQHHLAIGGITTFVSHGFSEKKTMCPFVFKVSFHKNSSFILSGNERHEMHDLERRFFGAGRRFIKPPVAENHYSLQERC